jgi:hypothetical protein
MQAAIITRGVLLIRMTWYGCSPPRGVDYAACECSSRATLSRHELRALAAFISIVRRLAENGHIGHDTSVPESIDPFLT